MKELIYCEVIFTLILLVYFIDKSANETYSIILYYRVIYSLRSDFLLKYIVEIIHMLKKILYSEGLINFNYC